ncbi:hypothetical protein MSHI_41000 [Mycobacterium shinjukuense]|uniref:Uncharacterized protein n=1 Tax=Mycobacterium shinjukuense TaxID=398694 RepID=A0A7I7MV93_9MYCO|nr:hypothetical protein MSHI_41000 [Mycobacterium shinjukuense]
MSFVNTAVKHVTPTNLAAPSSEWAAIGSPIADAHAVLAGAENGSAGRGHRGCAVVRCPSGFTRTTELTGAQP